MHDRINGASLPSVMALAYLGDASHSLYVRRMLVERGISKSAELNALAQRYVTAQAQAQMMLEIQDELLDDEKEVCTRAQNSTHLNKPKHAKLYEYRLATGFEALVGMLEWLGDTERLNYLLKIAHMEIKTNDTED